MCTGAAPSYYFHCKNHSRCGYLVSPQGAALAVKADVHKVLVPDDCLEVAGHGVPVVVPRQPEQLAHPAPLLTQRQRAISISEKYKIRINAVPLAVTI